MMFWLAFTGGHIFAPAERTQRCCLPSRLHRTKQNCFDERFGKLESCLKALNKALESYLKAPF